MTEYETLKRLVVEAEEDVAKAIGGNKAAGTRVRKKMQEIKSAAQDVRKKILEGREGEAPAGDAGSSKKTEKKADVVDADFEVVDEDKKK